MGSWNFLNVMMGAVAFLAVMPVAGFFGAEVSSLRWRMLGYAVIFLVGGATIGLVIGLQSYVVTVLLGVLALSGLELLMWQHKLCRRREEVVWNSLRQLGDALGAARRQGQRIA
jgi:hypothetical protein